MAAQIFLAIVGLLYGVLAVLCLMKPDNIMKKLGLQAIHSGGQSEFFTIYVGMEAAFAVIFLLPLLNASYTQAVLLMCTILHGGLAITRTASYFLYMQVPSFLYRLGSGEWIIFVLSAIFALQNAKV